MSIAGAIYCDVSIKGFGFNGEHVRSESVLAVKTHKPLPQWTGNNTSVNTTTVCVCVCVCETRVGVTTIILLPIGRVWFCYTDHQIPI